MNPWLLTIPLAYLLGSIPFGYLLVRFFRKEDIRATGSGNIGATNVARSGAKGLGVATLLLDLGKAFLAVKIAQHFAPGVTDLAMAAAIAAILGHIYPVWLRFKGGKGIASALGVFWALTPMLALCIFVVFLVVVAPDPLRLARFHPRVGLRSTLRPPLRGPHVSARALRLPLHPVPRHRQAPRQYPPPPQRHGKPLRQEVSHPT